MSVGSDLLTRNLSQARLLAIHRRQPAPAIADVAGAVHVALESPIGYPALRRALTPDDQVAIIVDEQLAELQRFLVPLLEHLAAAGITKSAVTFLCTNPDSMNEWMERLPADFSQVKLEIHDPHNRKRLAYLATTKKGRRVYLNRTAIDADQLVVLSRRCYDPLLGFGGAEGAIYPALGDAETQQAAFDHLSMDAPGSAAWPSRQEAAEIAWLMGAPFFVQIIEGAGDEVSHVLGGPLQSSAEGQRLLNERWQIEVDELADTVIAQVGGEPGQHTFAALARAVACATRVVKPEGRIVLISGGSPELGQAAQLLRQADTPVAALGLLQENQPTGLAAAFQWASAARQANLYLLSSLPSDIVEELFATPLEHTSQVDRLVGDSTCLFLADADKTLALVKS